VRIVTVSWTCLPAYAAYLAYVKNDMPMRSRSRQEYVGSQCILSVIKERGISEDSVFVNPSFSRSDSTRQRIS